MLEKFERETIINFNQGEPIAYVFTYEKSWQKRIEQVLGIKPSEKNEHGGRTYVVPKKLITPPRKPRQGSKLAQKLAILPNKTQKETPKSRKNITPP